VKKKANPYSERLTVNLTPDQMRRLEEVRNVRSRKGKFVSKNDLLREAVNLYLVSQEDLPGSRRAIARGIEAKVEQVNEKVEQLSKDFQDFIQRVSRRS
jgi:Arc/MetJ-type ribon-helix-helix transcriptional regulator